ncbi:MAG: ferrochelatase [Acidobacteria bacterium RBG_16_64_8]|nr:MAG: ferrochelatase [Acidobacteria bacterium RBG_16_64_8]
MGVEIGDLLGVLLLAHGGPGSLDDIPAFLDRVRGGRPCSEQVVNEVREKYRHIGGASPLPGISQSTAKKLEKACGFPVYTGMLHWQPFLEDTIPRMTAHGISRALVICLVPHFSECSVGRYRQRTAATADRLGMSFNFVDSWHTLPPYIAGLADSIVSARKAFAPTPGAQLYVIFSAHSLPKAALPAGDPYELQLRETAEQVATKLALADDRWTVAYQSVSGPGSEWLGPSVDEVIAGLAGSGVRQVVLCPFGFVADQPEILYDLDVVLDRKARDLGVTISRTPLLNDGAALIDSLALLVERWKR